METPAKRSEAFQRDLAGWRSEFRRRFLDVLGELQGKFAARPGLAPAWNALEAFLSTEGKNVRPLLFLSAHQLFQEEPTDPTPALYRVACALELFHSFALVHDDIIDESATRRGQPTLHRRLAADAAERYGENLALVLGDILFGFTVENFLQPGLPAERATAGLRYFITVAQDTGLGEALELSLMRRPLDSVTEEDILNTYYLKTTRYTFEAPLLLGAILAGASETALLSLHDFARPLGLAFQIENDLHEVRHESAESLMSANDLRTGVKTLFLKRYHDSMPAADAARLRAGLASGQAANLSTLLPRPETIAAIVAELKVETAGHFQEARRVLLAAPLRPEQRAGLLALAAFIHRNLHHSEAPQVASASASA